MERAVTRLQKKNPKLTKMPIASKAVKKTENQHRPKLAAIENNKTTRCAAGGGCPPLPKVPAKITRDTEKPTQNRIPEKLTQNRIPEKSTQNRIPRKARTATTQGGPTQQRKLQEESVQKKNQVSTRNKTDQILPAVAAVGTATGRTASLAPPPAAATVMKCRATLSTWAFAPTWASQGIEDHHSLFPDNITNLDSLPELNLLPKNSESSSSSSSSNDPQQCREYANDIYQNLLVAEKKAVYRITPNLMGRQREIDASHRRILVDWLVLVHIKFEQLADTFHICMDILDRYLQLADVSKKDLQLVGITALYLASKYEEIYPDTITEFAFISAETYTTQEIREKEIDILRTLDYQLGKPNPLTFLRRYSTLMATTTQIHNLAKYFVDTSYLFTECRSLLPSQLAVGALALAAKVVTKLGMETIWSPTMEQYTWYTQNRASVFARHVLTQILSYYRLDGNRSRCSSIREKYSFAFHKVALFPRLVYRLETISQLEEL